MAKVIYLRGNEFRVTVNDKELKALEREADKWWTGKEDILEDVVNRGFQEEFTGEI